MLMISIIIGVTEEVLMRNVTPVVTGFLSERDLYLSSKETNITHVSKGFDFLGFTVAPPSPPGLGFIIVVRARSMVSRNGSYLGLPRSRAERPEGGSQNPAPNLDPVCPVGCARWVCPVGVPGGCTRWVCPEGVPGGCARWVCPGCRMT